MPRRLFLAASIGVAVHIVWTPAALADNHHSTTQSLDTDLVLVSPEALGDQTAYMAQVRQATAADAVEIATYDVYYHLFRGTLQKYAYDGKFDPGRLNESDWLRISRGVSDFRKSARENQLKYPNEGASSLISRSIGALGSAGTLYLTGNPFLGAGAGFALTNAVDTAGQTAGYSSYLRDTYRFTPPNVPYNQNVIVQQAGEIHSLCAQHRTCSVQHDNLFRGTISPISADSRSRLRSDTTLRNSAEIAYIRQELDKLRDSSRLAPPDSAQNQDADANTDSGAETDGEASQFELYWDQAIQRGLDTAQLEKPEPYLSEQIQAGTTILAGILILEGKQEEAQAIAMIGGAVAAHAKLSENGQGAEALQVAASMTNILTAAMTAHAILNKPDKSPDQLILETLATISRQITRLQESVDNGFFSTNANIRLTTQGILAQQRTILSQLDTVIDNTRYLSFAERNSGIQNASELARLQRLERRRIFENCKESILGFAGSTSSDFVCFDQNVRAGAFPKRQFVASGRASEHAIAELEVNSSGHFPFSNAVNLLLPRTKRQENDTGQVASEWYYYSEAALRIARKIASDGSANTTRLISGLNQLISTGESLKNELKAASETENVSRISDLYIDQVRPLATILDRRIVDDEYGFNAFTNLSTLPANRDFRQNLEIRLAKSRTNGVPVLKRCQNAPASAFQPARSAVSINETRKFMANPLGSYDPYESWSPSRIDGAGLLAPNYLDVVPPELVWAVTNGLGEVELCFSQFRPIRARFTDDAVSKWNFRLYFVLLAAVDVRFTPTPLFATELGVPTSEPVLVARWSASINCQRNYRSEGAGYPGERWFQSLFTGSVSAWQSGGCGESAMRGRLKSVMESRPEPGFEERIAPASPESYLSPITVVSRRRARMLRPLGAIQFRARQKARQKFQNEIVLDDLAPFEQLNTYSSISDLVRQKLSTRLDSMVLSQRSDIQMEVTYLEALDRYFELMAALEIAERHEVFRDEELRKEMRPKAILSVLSGTKISSGDRQTFRQEMTSHINNIESEIADRLNQVNDQSANASATSQNANRKHYAQSVVADMVERLTLVRSILLATKDAEAS